MISLSSLHFAFSRPPTPPPTPPPETRQTVIPRALMTSARIQASQSAFGQSNDSCTTGIATPRPNKRAHQKRHHVLAQTNRV